MATPAELLAAENELKKAGLARTQQNLAIAVKLAKVRQRSTADLESEKKLYEEIVKNSNSLYLKAEAHNKLLENRKEKREQEIRDLEKTLKLQAASGQQVRAADLKKLEDLKLLQAQLEEMNKLADASPKMAKALFSGDSAAAIAGLKSIGGSIEGQLTKSLSKAVMGATSLGAAMAIIAPAAVLFAVAALGAVIIELAVNLANAEANFMKATGANKDLARSMTESYKETRKFGASIEETNAAGADLRKTFTDFTFLNGVTQRELARSTTLLTKLGVESGVAAKNIQISTKALGMTGVQAAQTQLDLTKFATELGVPIGKMGEDFANNGNMLAKMGDQGVEAFKDLAIASKVTGMEMSKILAITDKFDTFEGAAEMAGKLNAAIGGNFVNAMDLMTATDPNERFQMIRDSILDAGLSFDSMSYYQQKFYTESLGLSDVGELALALSGDMDMVDESVGRTSQSYEEAAARAREMQTLQENLNIVFQNLIPVVTPLVDIMVDFTGWLAENHEMVRKVVAVLLILGGALALVVAVASGPLWVTLLGVAAAFAAVAAGVTLLSDVFFEDEVASTFLEGLGKIANAFGQIAIDVIGALNPITQMTKLVDGLGSLFGGILSGVTSFFAALTAPEAAENIMKIGEAITAIPETKHLEFVASMGAAAGAATVGAAVTRFLPEGATPGERPGATPSERPYQVTINLQIDKKNIASVVKELQGGMARDAIAGRA